MANELWRDIVYTDVLQSEGFVVDYAVCTTYSMDMPTLLSVPFMLGTMCDLTEATMQSPHLILEAVNRAANKFAVFCNAGCIAVPETQSKLYALMERSVVQVALPRKGAGFVNFHPKVWVVKETNPDTEEAQIKLVVMSRNLTCSTDLDVVCELVGKIGAELASQKAQRKHAPLVDFLRFLSNQTGEHTIRKHISNLCEDINRIKNFDLDGSPFDDYNFFPMGIPAYNGYDRCLQQNILNHAAEMLVISPFVDMNVLYDMTSCSPQAKETLITRHASVKQDMLELFNHGVYAPKEVLTDKAEKDTAVDLHEKVYFVRRIEGKQSRNHLFLGSTNATRNGFERNVEFLLHLQFAPHKTPYKGFRSEIINDDKDCMFEQVTAITDADGTKDDQNSERDMRNAIDCIKQAQINCAGNAYSITIRCKDVQGITAYLCPLGCDAKEQTLANDMAFEGLKLEQLTEFYVLRVKDLRRVIKITTKGMPTDERDKAIFRSLINTKAKFINYLAFMLTNDVEQYILESQQLERELLSGNAKEKEQIISTSLYEDMVRMAYTNPERIVAIGKIKDMADDSVVPKQFSDMYDTFTDALKQIKRL